MIQSHYVALERPYRIIYANGNVALQIGTLIVVDDSMNYQMEHFPNRGGNRAIRYFGYLGIKTHSYPVVSYINKRNDTDLSHTDIAFGGGEWSEAEVWSGIEQKDISTICLEGKEVKWSNIVEIITPMLHECHNNNDTLEIIIKLITVLKRINELGGVIVEPDKYCYNFMKKPNGETKVVVNLTYQKNENSNGESHPEITNAYPNFPFPFFAGTSELDEAYKIIRRQESFYQKIKISDNSESHFSFIFAIDDNNPSDGKDELQTLIEKLNNR